MSRALVFLASGLLLAGATLGCNAASTQPRLQHPSEQSRPTSSAPAFVRVVVDQSTWSDASSPAASDDPFDPGFEPVQETIVTVDPYSVAESSQALRFLAATRGDRPAGVRVFFATEEDDSDVHLGLRRADRIEEIDGLPVAGLEAFLSAWRSLGTKPEVRFSMSRAGRPHTVIYRRRTPGMLLAY